MSQQYQRRKREMLEKNVLTNGGIARRGAAQCDRPLTRK